MRAWLPLSPDVSTAEDSGREVGAGVVAATAVPYREELYRCVTKTDRTLR